MTKFNYKTTYKILKSSISKHETKAIRNSMKTYDWRHSIVCRLM